jgi:hypothetical protein
VKRLLSLTSIVLATFLAACGGSGSSNITPPPSAGNFSKASLSGQYAFSMSGLDAQTGGFIARVGSFGADSKGNITGGLEDILSLGNGTTSLVTFTGGTYDIQPNGRGIMTLLASGGGGLQLSFEMKTTSQGFLIQTDLAATSSGSFFKQNVADFAASSINGKYVFDFSGVSFLGNQVAPISIIGRIAADGNGNVTGGTVDENDGNVTPSGPITLDPGTFLLDSNGNGTGFGRGTIAFDGRTFAFYIVDATHFKAIEEDDLGGTAGDAVLQTGVIPAQNSAFTGSFVFLTGGSTTLGSQGPDARAARFTSDGNGGLSAISLDDNNDGNYTHISQGSNISNASYTIDAANAGSGRGTFTFKDSSAGTFTYVFYLSSPTQGVLQDTSNGVVGDGTFLAQIGSPFTLANVAGTFIFNWTGIQLGSQTAVPFEEDFVGQYTLTTATSNNIAGVIDYVELGLSTSDNPFLNFGISGTLTINGDGTNNNKYQIVIGGSPSSTFNYQAYIAGPDTILLVCSDDTRTTAGIVSVQPQ